MIPYGRQSINSADVEAVVEVLRSDYLTQGPVVPKFESAVANACNASFGVAVGSATAALHLAVDALGLGPGDWLWTSPISFVASANCGLYCGAKIDFVDIDPKTYNMCPIALEVKLLEADKAGKLPKVIVPVHLAGMSCPMREISSIANRYGVKIVEDASHGIGGRYLDDPVGSCKYSDVTVFSFHPVKIITTAEGGIALTNDSELASRMARRRSHGVTRDPELMTCEPDGPWYYQMVELGWNYRMTELQAALGLSQLARLESFIDKRNQMADRYEKILSHLPIDLPIRQLKTKSAFHLYIIQLRESQLARKKEIFDQLIADGIGVNLHYIPIHLQPYYQSIGFKAGAFEAAETYYKKAISIPLFPGLLESEQDSIAEALERALS